MSEIVVWGTVPVAIHVDTEEERVTRVVVIDESLRYPENIDTPVENGELAVSTDGYQPYFTSERPDTLAEDRAEASKALEIARDPQPDHSWPAWNFGY